MSSTFDRFDPDSSFDEAWYVRNYEDIASAVATGKQETGWQHYSEHGRAEGRQPYDPRLIELIEQANEQLAGRLFQVDELVTAAQTGLLAGWIDDRSDPLERLVLQPYFGPAIDLLPGLARCRRDDVADMLGVPRDVHDYGFWVAFDGLVPGVPPVGARLEIRFESGRGTELHVDMRQLAMADLRGRMLQAASWERNVPGDLREMGRLAGPVVRALTRAMLARSVTSPPVRFGGRGGRPALSVIITSLDGAATALLQAPFLAAAQGLGRAEIIYVHAGAGAAPQFEATVGAVHELYGLSTAALRCSGGPGLPRGRNAGADAATGGLLLFLAPDAMPAPGWLDRALDHAKADAITGAALLDDGEALISCGLAWGVPDPTTGLWGVEPRLAGVPAARAPAEPVAVDAVSADALLVPRQVLTSLAGFEEDFALRDGDDLDLCLRARRLEIGVQVDPGLQVHILPPGDRQPDEAERGASLLNRLRFDELWAATFTGLA